MLRALQFMDNMIQRDVMQKMAFLTDLTSFWNSFDDRILRLKVHPKLLCCIPSCRIVSEAVLLHPKLSYCIPSLSYCISPLTV